MIPGRRVETFLIAAILVLGALAVRVHYIPAYAAQQLAEAEGRLGLNLGEPSKWFAAWSLGDGQAYALIAADPTGGRLGEHVGEPAYRFSRAGFGWLAAMASLGQERWVPYGLAIAGVASLVGLLILAVRLRERLGPKSWWLVLNPAIFLAFGGDTAESLGVLLLALALACGSIWAAVGLGVTRPT